jgi:hypothetical protein
MVTLTEFIRRNRLPAAVVFTLLTMDLIAIAMFCIWGQDSWADRLGGGKIMSPFPTRLHPFVQKFGDYDLNCVLLALACSQVTLLTLWVVNGRAALEIRWGSLILGIAVWIGILHLFYGEGIPVPALGALFSGQVGTLFAAVALLRRRLFQQDERQVSTRRNLQFSIRTLLLATTLIAIFIVVAPYLGILIKDPYPQRPQWPLVVNQWKLVLGTCCGISALISIVATQGNPRIIPFRIALAGLISSFLVVALVWLAVDHDFFYPSFSTFRPIRYDFYIYRHLYQPWVSWIAIQVVIVSSVLLAFRWKSSTELVQTHEAAT